jgi:hypothetical protein
MIIQLGGGMHCLESILYIAHCLLSFIYLKMDDRYEYYFIYWIVIFGVSYSQDSIPVLFDWGYYDSIDDSYYDYDFNIDLMDDMLSPSSVSSSEPSFDPSYVPSLKCISILSTVPSTAPIPAPNEIAILFVTAITITIARHFNIIKY